MRVPDKQNPHATPLHSFFFIPYVSRSLTHSYKSAKSPPSIVCHTSRRTILEVCLSNPAVRHMNYGNVDRGRTNVKRLATYPPPFFFDSSYLFLSIRSALLVHLAFSLLFIPLLRLLPLKVSNTKEKCTNKNSNRPQLSSMWCKNQTSPMPTRSHKHTHIRINIHTHCSRDSTSQCKFGCTF
ncbi:hypothetical protein BKA57DRAFT_446065 [Linnemannia elongata]|nr:hypothetical protein BKA57DRAFT_446065 [Linnemannia elongata]